MNQQLKLTIQDVKIVNFLQSRNNSPVYWEELAQFAKDPSSVKKKTIQKSVSEIKRKYKLAGLTLPFAATFLDMPESPTDNLDCQEEDAAVIEPPTKIKDEQTLVKVKATPQGTVVRIDAMQNKSSAQIDFEIDRASKRVKTRFGSHQLNDNEWDMFKYFYNNVGKIIKLSELRDKVVYPLYGSKVPARWFNAIQRIINNLRRQVPGLKNRLHTIPGEETGYLFQ